MQIRGKTVGVLDIVQSSLGSSIVLVEQLSQSGAVVVRVLEVLLSLSVVALGDAQIAQSLVESVGIGSLGDEVFSLCHVAVLEGNQTQCGVSLGSVVALGDGLCQQFLGLGLVASVECHDSQVVQRTIVVGVELSGLGIDFFLLGSIFLESSVVEQLVGRQLGSVLVVLSLNLLVVAADGLVVDDEA